MEEQSYNQLKSLKLYTLGHLVQFTGLSKRTLHNYLALGLLKGEKLNGVWHFNKTQIEEFVQSKSVRPSILAKNNALVYDFLLDDNKNCDQICIALDLPKANREDVCEFFCYEINNGDFKNLNFSLDAPAKKQVRIIIKGNACDVLTLVQKYYASKKPDDLN